MDVNSCSRFYLSLQGLNHLLNSDWYQVEISPLDFWDGLLPFDIVAHTMIIKDGDSILEIKDDPHFIIQVEIILHRITEKFLYINPYASTKEELRRSPSFVVMPGDCQTSIAGIVFKLDNNGTTFICYPPTYHTFWMCWFQINGIIVNEVTS